MVPLALPKNPTIHLDQMLVEGIADMTAIAGQNAELRICNLCPVWKSYLMETPELANLVPNALVPIVATEAGRGSRGTHAQEDYLKRDGTNRCKQALAVVNPDGTVRCICGPFLCDPPAAMHHGVLESKKTALKARVN